MAPSSPYRFLVNPAGGRGRAGKQLGLLRRLAAEVGAPLEVSESGEDLVARARRAADEGVERLLVAGGDGTAHLGIEGVAGSETALAIVPLGSGNDLAATLGMPADTRAAVERGLTAPTRWIDLASVGGTPYGCVAGVGFDSAANETANRVRFSLGPLLYVYSVLHTLATFKPPRLTIEYEGGSFDGGAMLVVLANAPRFGGGMRVAPMADVDDGLLELVIVKEVSRATFLRVFPKVYSGQHIGHPMIVHASTPWAEVEIDRPMAVYGDGERLVPVPDGGVRFEVARRGLKVVR